MSSRDGRLREVLPVGPRGCLVVEGAGADPPPPAEEIHIWTATADRITRHVTIPRQQAAMPLLMSVLHAMTGEPEHGQRASVLPFTQNSRPRTARG